MTCTCELSRNYERGETTCGTHHATSCSLYRETFADLKLQSVAQNRVICVYCEDEMDGIDGEIFWCKHCGTLSIAGFMQGPAFKPWTIANGELNKAFEKIKKKIAKHFKGAKTVRLTAKILDHGDATDALPILADVELEPEEEKGKLHYGT